MKSSIVHLGKSLSGVHGVMNVGLVWVKPFSHDIGLSNCKQPQLLPLSFACLFARFLELFGRLSHTFIVLADTAPNCLVMHTDRFLAVQIFM